MLAEADPVAAEFAPLYVRGLMAGHTRDELRAMPVPLVAVVLGTAVDGDEPVLKGARRIVLDSDVPDRPDRPGRSKPPRARKRRETGTVYRGKDAR